MDEDVWLEDRLFPWLADGSMGDETIDEGYVEEPWYFCDECGAGCDDETSPCPDCGHEPEADEFQPLYDETGNPVG